MPEIAMCLCPNGETLNRTFDYFSGVSRLGIISPAFVVIFCFLGSVTAQEGPIRLVRIGFPQAPGFGETFLDPRLAKGLARPGMTHPVVVELATGHGGQSVEVLQPDESGRFLRKKQLVTSNRAALSFPLSSVKAAPVTVRLIGSEGQTLSEQVVLVNALPSGKPLVLCLGSIPGGARRLWGNRPSTGTAQLVDSNKVKNADEGAVAIALVDNPADLPLEVDAYETTDLILAPMDQDRDSVVTMAAQSARQALVGALRNGSRLVIGASTGTGKVQGFITSLNDASGVWLDATPGSLTELSEPRRLDRMYRWLDSRKPFEALPIVKVQNWLPGRSAFPLAPEPGLAASGSAPEIPALWPLWEIPTGRGAVLAMAFPLDGAPLALWRGEEAFFRRLLAWSGAMRSGGTTEDLGAGFAQAVGFNQELARILGTFPGVVLFSFGWVLLAILGYLILIGPVEWWIIDRICKRPGLTWIALPLTVLISCALIPLVVSMTKGSGMRINQIHIVAYDLADPKPVASGTSWISLFSPSPLAVNAKGRVHGEWSGTKEEVAVRVVPWNGPRGGATLLPAQQDLVDLNKGEVQGLDLGVNTDQAFRADWIANIEPGKAPLASELFHPLSNPSQLVGSVTNRLRVAIESPIFIYRGRFHPLERSILPGETVNLDELRLGGGGKGQEILLQVSLLAAKRSGLTSSLLPANGPDSLRHQPIKQLFLSESRFPGLSGTWNLRWRIFAPFEDSFTSNQGTQSVGASLPRDEVILLGRTDLVASGVSETGPLMLELATKNPATVLHETYLRAILPVGGAFSSPVKTVKP